LRVVGRGAFGKVRIVERKDTNLSFALKYIRKDEGKSLSVPIFSLHHWLRSHDVESCTTSILGGDCRLDGMCSHLSCSTQLIVANLSCTI
jgi:serine/threonine protein kinase